MFAETNGRRVKKEVYDIGKRRLAGEEVAVR